MLACARETSGPAAQAPTASSTAAIAVFFIATSSLFQIQKWISLFAGSTKSRIQVTHPRHASGRRTSATQRRSALTMAETKIESLDGSANALDLCEIRWIVSSGIPGRWTGLKQASNRPSHPLLSGRPQADRGLTVELLRHELPNHTPLPALAHIPGGKAVRSSQGALLLLWFS